MRLRAPQEVDIVRCGAGGPASLQLLLEVQCLLAQSWSKQQHFELILKAEAWGPCTKLVCSSSVGEEGRTVYCGGSDGGVYDGAPA